MKIKSLHIGRKIEFIKRRTRENALNIPARSSLYFTATNLIAKAASFLFTPVFTRLLTPDEYGTYSLFSSYLSVAIVIVTLEIPGNVIMRAFQKKRGLENLCTVTAAAIPFVLALPCVAVIGAVRGGLDFPFAYTALAFSLISVSFINLYTSTCKFLYRWRAPFFIAVLQSVVTPAAAVILIRSEALGEYENAVLKIVTGSIISALIALILFSVSLTRASREARGAGMNFSSYMSFAKELYKTLLSLCLPLLPYYASVMVISQADKLLISHYLGKEALGKYSLAYSAGIALTAVTGGIMSALCPWIMRKVRAGDFSSVRRALGAITDLALPAIVIFLAAAPEIFGILAPKSYLSALPVLFISAAIPLPLALCGCLCSIAVAKEKTGGILLSGIFSATLAAILDFYLIGQSALYVPSLITAASYTVLMLLAAASVKRILTESAINVNKTLRSVLFLAFFSALLYTLRAALLPRAVIAIFAALYLMYMLVRSKWLLGERNEGAKSTR